MKKLLLFLFAILPFVSFGQCISIANINYTFENPGYNHNCLFQRDTIANPNNIWHIGAPHKTVFWIAYSATRVIVTDTANTYPVNDTSSFTIAKRVGFGTLWHNTHTFGGYYRVHSDTLADYGFIEFSPDNGDTWIDLTHDTTGFANWTYMAAEKPVFSGNGTSWKHFSCKLNFLVPPFTFNYNDTVKYRFTFISDSIDTHKDGLMFDDIFFEDWAEDVPFISSNNHIISIYPNPATNQIRIQSPTHTSQKRIQILNYAGALIKQINEYTGNDIDVSYLPPGMYVLKYTDDQWSDAALFQVRH